MIAQSPRQTDDKRQDRAWILPYDGIAPQGDKGESFVWSA